MLAIRIAYMYMYKLFICELNEEVSNDYFLFIRLVRFYGGFDRRNIILIGTVTLSF